MPYIDPTTVTHFQSMDGTTVTMSRILAITRFTMWLELFWSKPPLDAFVRSHITMLRWLFCLRHLLNGRNIIGDNLQRTPLTLAVFDFRTRLNGLLTRGPGFSVRCPIGTLSCLPTSIIQQHAPFFLIN